MRSLSKWIARVIVPSASGSALLALERHVGRRRFAYELDSGRSACAARRAELADVDGELEAVLVVGGDTQRLVPGSAAASARSGRAARPG